MRIKRGLLIPYPCEVCGKKKVEAHHDDYNKPYDIRWLCFKHHREYHKEIRRKELKMIEFSAISKFKLATCHPDLVTLFNEVLQLRNCTILEGYRGKQAQEAAFEAGKSKLHYPNGNHNKNPSMAVDAAPWPIPEWNDEKEFIYFAGIVVGVACKLFDECKMTHRIRWGGAWDGIDKMNTGQMLSDLDHFELIPLMEAKSNVTV
jgi:peptidoglycan L-alanyl-D-glutamate endopeptidase CwlK